MAENGTRSSPSVLITTTSAPGIEQYLVFIYIGVAFLVLLVASLSVMLVVFVIKRNKMLRQMHPKHDLAGNLPNNDALTRYYSLGMNDGASTLRSGIGTLTGKHSTLDKRSNVGESLKPSSIHSPNHDSYVVKSNPLFKGEEDQNNAASDKGYGSQENTATGLTLSQHLSSLQRTGSVDSFELLTKNLDSQTIDLTSPESSFKHAAEIHGQCTALQTNMYSNSSSGQDNLAFVNETNCSRQAENSAVDEIDQVLKQSAPSASESALKKISISRRAQISLNREALPSEAGGDSDSNSSADSDNESCYNMSRLNSIPVIREGQLTPNQTAKRRTRTRHSYENTDPFNNNAPVKPPKPPSLSRAARKLSIERHSLNVKLNVSISSPNTTVFENGGQAPPPPPPSTLPPPLNGDSDNESSLAVQSGVYEDVDVKVSPIKEVSDDVQVYSSWWASGDGMFCYSVSWDTIGP